MKDWLQIEGMLNKQMLWTIKLGSGVNAPWQNGPLKETPFAQDLKSPEHGLGINMGNNLNYP